MNGPRERMVESAARLLAERGYEATSVMDVIEGARAPRGSIYHHFPGGKDQLIGEAIRWQSDRAVALLDTLAGRSAPDVVDGFVQLWRTLLTRTTFSVGCSLVGVTVSGSNREQRGDAGAAFQRWISRLGQLLVDGGIPADRAEGAAIMVIAGTEGAVVMARALRSLGPLDTVGHQLRSLAEELMSRPAKRTRRPR